MAQQSLARALNVYKRVNAHVVMPFAYEIAAHSAILDVVEGILGPDILLYSTEFLSKEPQTKHVVNMHQDLAYWGLGEIDGILTAWLALSPATPQSGCMDFVKGSHKNPIVPYEDSFDELNLLSRGQEIKVDAAEEDKSSGTLATGKISLHHGLMIHGSGANTSHNRGIGVVMRFLSPHVKKTKQCALLRRAVARPLKHWKFHPLRRTKGLVSSRRSFTLGGNSNRTGQSHDGGRQGQCRDVRMMDQVKFRAMKDGDAADYAFLTEHEIEHTKGTADRLLQALVMLDEGLSGYQVTRLGHSLQSATRAERDGADTDWIVSALLHDIGDIFAPYNHDEYAASILRPFVREQCAWVVEKHGDFQMIYYGHHVGGNPDKRETYRGHIYFNDCATFCERWDQNSFDPKYDTLPIEHFADRVQEVFARQPYDPTVLRPGAREALVS